MAIKFKSVSVTPTTVSVKQGFKIAVEVDSNITIFKFPLVLKTLGTIFKRRL